MRVASGQQPGPRQRWPPRWALKPSLILSRLCSRARNDSHSLRRRAWAFQGPSRLSTHGHAFTHTHRHTDLHEQHTLHTRCAGMCPLCAQTQTLREQHTDMYTHAHTHTHTHACTCITLRQNLASHSLSPLRVITPRSSLCLGGTCLDTCLAPSLTS